ncbi:choline/ethanolamine kinase family protein [Butyrivibrio sp. AE3009]|uniref:choline/ethanolamine kinase family protein n=1 Tax=Butyrivibrio sp. AE3009 TaxID=1280666 RepID=UPI0003B45CB1|nr:choline/ethanolamine kinase family protein [Butyrivibrio sp. AE3009]
MDDVKKAIASLMDVSPKYITDIQSLKKGMTNQSFLFYLDNKKYIFRLPGAGTEQLVDRKQEMASYKAIEGKDICSSPIYIDEKGYKITEFVDNARVCNPKDIADVSMCIKALRKMHSIKLSVDHEFNLFQQIDKYEMLWGDNQSVHDDYKETKRKVQSLKDYVSANSREHCLTHIDAVPDNFLITGKEKVELIDWEYAGMQDPHVDIAMFAIYSYYGKAQIDQLIDIYFCDECEGRIRAKIYCYVAICGLLWSNWCEFKQMKGNHFGEYSQIQYNYAKDFYEIARKEINDNV